MLSPADVPVVPELEALAPLLLARVIDAPPSAWVPMPATTMYRGDWVALLFSAGPWAREFPAANIAANLEIFPEAVGFLARHPEISVFGVLRLAPGGELLPHRDHRPNDEVRVHVPMQLGGEDGPEWAMGKARLLDVRSLHHSVNRGALPRFTLVADVRMPHEVAEGSVPPWNTAPSPE